MTANPQHAGERASEAVTRPKAFGRGELAHGRTERSARVSVRSFTDPGCPWAFSAERQRLRLDWLYGDQLELSSTLVGLSESAEAVEASGFTPDRLAGALHLIASRFGMPIDWTQRERSMASLPACRAVVAAREHGGPAEALLRRIRVRYMGGGLLDDPALIDAAAADVGIEPGELQAWSEAPETETALRADLAAARDPSPAARLLDHKLGGPAEERRYTCPSWTLTGPSGTSLDLPGFQPVEAYEVALANLAPELERHAAPESAVAVLEWAGEPLATAEVAAVLDTQDLAAVHTELAYAGAAFEPVGQDGYWSP